MMGGSMFGMIGPPLLDDQLRTVYAQNQHLANLQMQALEQQRAMQKAMVSTPPKAAMDARKCEYCGTHTTAERCDGCGVRK